MDWPAKSPDLNPIENIWGLMKRQVAPRIHGDHRLPDLRRIVTEEWNGLPMVTVNRCIASMRNRSTEVIVVRGGSTHY